MKHKKQGRILGRNRAQRKALLRSLVSALIINKKIKTTLAKAKELRPTIDAIIDKTKKGLSDEKKKVATIRLLRNKMDEPAWRELRDEKFWRQFEKREGGYTRIVKLPRRSSDGAEMAIIEFVK